MHKDTFVFAQLVQFLNRSKYNRIVAKYDGDKYVESYTCCNQLPTLMFGQLSNRESLRDLIVAMEAPAGKLYNLSIGKSVTRSNLSRANEQHDMRLERNIYEVLQILGISVTDKTHLKDLFDKPNFKNVNVLYGSSEPNLFNF